MTLLKEFYDLLMPELPGCSTAMVDHQLRQTAREFCLRTGAWRLPFDPMNLLAGQGTYDLDSPEPESEVVKLYSFAIGGKLLWQDADHAPAGTALHLPYLRNTPPFTLSPDLLELTLAPELVPSADASGGLQLVGSLKPNASATRLPEFLKSQYSDTMRHGVLSRLMLMAKKPWTDRDLASVYAGRWQAELNFAAYQVQVGNTRAALRVKKSAI